MKENPCKKCGGVGKYTKSRWGLRFGAGSMGYGLPFAVGVALAKKMKGEEGTVYCLMSDGELAIGTTFESVLIAEQHKLDNLKVIIDCNGLQAMGKIEDVLDTRNLHEEEFDGHDYTVIEQALGNGERYVNAKTVKGKGVSFFEGENIWHYKSPNEDEYNRAMEELSCT